MFFGGWLAKFYDLRPGFVIFLNPITATGMCIYIYIYISNHTKYLSASDRGGVNLETERSPRLMSKLIRARRNVLLPGS